MNPKISVILPVHNAGKYLHKCIDSILAQTYNNYEVLLIDDGSTDNSGKICDEYASKDKRITVIHKPNGGVSSARNVGIENSKGDWIYFVDADDYLKPETLKIFDSLLSETVDLIMCGYDVVDEDNEVLFVSFIETPQILSYSMAIKEMYSSSNGCYQGYIWCKLLRKSVVDKNKLRFNEKIFFNEDRLFLIQYLCASKKNVVYSETSVYNYVSRKTGAMASLKSNTYNRLFSTDFEAYCLMKKEIEQLPYSAELLSLANKGIRASYDWNHNLMYENHDCDTKIHWQMVIGLIKTGIFFTFVKDLFKPLFMFVCPAYFCRQRN